MQIGASGTQVLGQFTAHNKPKLPTEQQPGDRAGIKSDAVDVSSLGQLKNKLEGLGEQDKAAMADFRSQIKDAKDSGNFDAAVLADKAPDALKQAASELGVEVEELVGQMSRGKPPRPEAATGEGAAQANLYAQVEDQPQQQGFFSGMMSSLFGKS